MKVVVTEAAWSDMLDIARGIARDNPRRADSFLDELFKACQEIGSLPFGYPLVENREAEGIRRKVHGNYLIFYRLREEVVEILRILHGARDHEKANLSEA